MTTEKAIEKVKRVKGIYAYEGDYEALDMAIFALEERQNALDTAMTYEEAQNEIHDILYKLVVHEYESMLNRGFDPDYMKEKTTEILQMIQNQGGIFADNNTATRQSYKPKYGEWETNWDRDTGMSYYKCPICGYEHGGMIANYNFCPRCGKIMKKKRETIRQIKKGQ